MPESASKVAHIVFFTLKDRTDSARQALVASCDKYLQGHPGVDYYSAGIRGEDFTRPVNDDQYDVALHIIFASREAHDAYQTMAEHVQFIEENKASWAQIRVFDSYI